jgi:hypothetical protein
MAAQSTQSTSSAAQASDRFAGVCAMLAGITGFLYSLSFVLLKNNLLIDLCLMVGALFVIPALTGLYSRVKEVEGTVALLAWILGIVGALGALIHGGYDLANVINPPAAGSTIASLPSAIDPRGLLTFGMAGLGYAGFAWVIGRSGMPRWSGYLAYLLAIMLVVLYLGRLIILDPKNPLIVVDGGLTGFIVNPLWYLWLGVILWQYRKAA